MRCTAYSGHIMQGRQTKGEMDLGDTETRLLVMEALKQQLESDLKTTSNKLGEWKGGYQHLQGMWQHKVAKWAAAEWQIQEMEDYLCKLTEAASEWPEIKQGYDIEIKENVRRLEMT